jgi:hypothetical protein
MAPRLLAITMPVPSGVQYCTWSSPECQVSCRGSPPSDGMTNTSSLPVRLLSNAIHRPSGENRGRPSRPTLAVSRRGLAPFESATQMSS